MKILFTISDFGSFNLFLSELAISLVEHGHEVHVICPKDRVIDLKDKYSYRKTTIVFHYIAFPRNYNLLEQLSVSRKIHRIIESIRPDVIDAHFTTGILTTLLYKKPKYKIVGTFHGLGYPVIESPLKKMVFRLVEQFCFRRLDEIWLLNQIDYQIVRKLHPEKANLLASAGVGCDLQRFSPVKTDPVETVRLRKSLGIRDDDFVIMFTGRFVDFKGFHLVVKAFLRLVRVQQVDKLKLILVGGPDDIHPNGLTAVERRMLEATESIIKVGFTSEVESYLALSNLFVFPSKKEGVPVCIMEALAMGVPVLTLNTRGCSDLVQHQKNGILLDSNASTMEIAEAILALYRSPELLREFSDNAISNRDKLSRNIYVAERSKSLTNSYLCPTVEMPSWQSAAELSSKIR